MPQMMEDSWKSYKTSYKDLDGAETTSLLPEAIQITRLWSGIKYSEFRCRIFETKTLEHLVFEPSKNATVISEDDQLRSDFVRDLVQTTHPPVQPASESAGTIPKTIVQFWDAPDSLPSDVQECLESWSLLDATGFDRVLFDDHRARLFIAETFTAHHIEAFDRCYHPAMKSDYFRLCYIFSRGGCYIDADDAYRGTDIEHLFADDRLKLQPLCYDCDTGSMVKPSTFTRPGNYSRSWIYYFNNNPIIAPPGDPVLKYALRRATGTLVNEDISTFPEIQSTTGPGNLTASLVAHAATDDSYRQEGRLLVLSDWESHARTVWPLSYRQDARNWRLSNRRRFFRQR
jgi:hypothetical protein